MTPIAGLDGPHRRGWRRHYARQRPHLYSSCYGRAPARRLLHTVSTHLKPDEAPISSGQRRQDLLRRRAIRRHRARAQCQQSQPVRRLRHRRFRWTAASITPPSSRVFDRMIELGDGPVGKDFFYSRHDRQAERHQATVVRQPQASTGLRRLGPRELQLRGGYRLSVARPALPRRAARIHHAHVESGGNRRHHDEFSAEPALAAIERYRVTHSQWVPTMLFRLLVAARGGTHPLRSVFASLRHPCRRALPAGVKQQIHRTGGDRSSGIYYAGSERNGATCISTAEWLAHRGSVGRACVGTIHISTRRSRMSSDRAKSVTSILRAAIRLITTIPKRPRDPAARWAGRPSAMSAMSTSKAISISPTAARHDHFRGRQHLSRRDRAPPGSHPQVAAVACRVRIPHQEYGEEVKAVVSAQEPIRRLACTRTGLMAFCRAALSHLKCPRSNDFDPHLPRQENGKLFKHVV